MKTATKKVKVADSYLKLICEFPLRPIRNHAEYDSAIAVMEKLAVRGEEDLDTGEQDYLDALDEFVSIYDQRHFSFPADKRTPLARLKYVLSESGTSSAQLQDLLGCSQSLVSMILSGTRELSKDNIRSLAAHFKVDAGMFL